MSALSISRAAKSAVDPSFRIIILENLFLDRVKFIGVFIRGIDRVNFDSRKSGNRVDRDWGFM